MNILLCDNEVEKLVVLKDYLTTGCGWTIAEEKSIAAMKSRLETAAQLPDLVLLDLAFSGEEEDLLDLLEVEPESVSHEQLRQISGICACTDLSRRMPELPVIVLSKVHHPNLATIAYGAGAKAYVQKDALASLIAGTLETIHKSIYPYHTTLYELLNGVLSVDSGAFVVQHRRILSTACRLFFSNDDPVGRYSRLCIQLSPLLGMAGDEKTAMTKMLPLMTTSHALLGLAAKGTRDHILHSGNVYWLALYLWKELGLWKNESRASCVQLEKVEDYLAALTVASLFHDIGYIGERAPKAEKQLSQILGAEVRLPFDMQDAGKVANSIDELANALGEFPNTEWASVLSIVAGKIKEGDIEPDHGLLGAAWLFVTTSEARAKSKLTNRIGVEAACAVAMHTFEKWGRILPGGGANFTFGPEKSTIVWLLAVCDFLQNWDREVPELYVADDPDALYTKSSKARLKGWTLVSMEFNPKTRRLALTCQGQITWGADIAGEQSRAMGNVRTWYESRKWETVIKAHCVGNSVVPVVKYGFIDGPTETLEFSIT